MNEEWQGSSSMSPQLPQSELNVELHIESMVLDGFGDVDGATIGAAVERGLVRLFAERGVPANLHMETIQASIDAGTLRVSADDTPDAIGIQIAQAVYGGFSG